MSVDNPEQADMEGIFNSDKKELKELQEKIIEQLRELDSRIAFVQK